MSDLTIIIIIGAVAAIIAVIQSLRISSIDEYVEYLVARMGLQDELIKTLQRDLKNLWNETKKEVNKGTPVLEEPVDIHPFMNLLKDQVYPVFFFIKLNDNRTKAGTWKIPAEEITNNRTKEGLVFYRRIVQEGIIEDGIVTEDELSRALVFCVLPGVLVNKNEILN